MELFVKTCLICQQDKGKQQLPIGLLEPLPIPERPWEFLSIDFIIKHLKVNGYTNIIMVVDLFSEYVIFIPVSSSFNFEYVAKLIFKHIVMYWSISKSIISDQDARLRRGFESNCSRSWVLIRISPPASICKPMDKWSRSMDYWKCIRGTL